MLKGTVGIMVPSVVNESYNTYLIGTDEGDIYLCTTEYASTFLASYQAHATPVYNIMWNTFIPSVFISCAAEWSVKIWDMNYRLF